MTSLLRIAALLLGSTGCSVAKVQFASSTMYDIYDFQGVAEVPLRHCDNGCLIFASTFGDARQDPYLTNLIVSDGNRELSIAEVAFQFQPDTSQKLPFDISEAGKYNLTNRNALAALGSDVTVWVVERAKAHNTDYEIYDAAAMKRGISVPNSVLTIMSAARFAVYAVKGEINAYAARQVGFDAAFENSVEKCAPVYQTSADSVFDGFKFYVDAPIISFVFTHKTKVDLRADFNYLNTRKISNPAFITSPGYHGCEHVDDDQVYRSKQYHNSDQIELHGEPDFYEVIIESKSELAEGQEISVIANGQATKLATGRLQSTINITNAQIVTIYYKVTAPESFSLHYTATSKATPTCELKTAILLYHETFMPLPENPTSTTTPQAPSTSTVGAATGVAALVVVCTKLLALRDHLQNN